MVKRSRCRHTGGLLWSSPTPNFHLSVWFVFNWWTSRTTSTHHCAQWCMTAEKEGAAAVLQKFPSYIAFFSHQNIKFNTLKKILHLILATKSCIDLINRYVCIFFKFGKVVDCSKLCFFIMFPTLQQAIKKHYHPLIDLEGEAALSINPLWCFKLRSAVNILQLLSGSGWIMAVAFIESSLSGWNRECGADYGAEVPPASGWLAPGFLSLFSFAKEWNIFDQQVPGSILLYIWCILFACDK